MSSIICILLLIPFKTSIFSSGLDTALMVLFLIFALLIHCWSWPCLVLVLFLLIFGLYVAQIHMVLVLVIQLFWTVSFLLILFWYLSFSNAGSWSRFCHSAVVLVNLAFAYIVLVFVLLKYTYSYSWFWPGLRLALPTSYIKIIGSLEKYFSEDESVALDLVMIKTRTRPSRIQVIQ